MTLGRPFSSPKLGSLSPAQQPGNAWVPVKPLRAKSRPVTPASPRTLEDGLVVLEAVAVAHLHAGPAVG